MMYTTYILKSLREEWFYVGHTSDLRRRLDEHNSGKNKSTRPHRPFEVVYEEKFPSKGQVFGREMQIKRYRHGEAFKKLISVYCRVV